MFKISVVIPAYNAEKYIGDCIESILKQTFSDFEIIIIDDGSSDETGTICDYYAKNNNHIKVIHNSNKGPAASRRIGVENAIGDYVAFIDADDWVAEEYFRVLYEDAIKYSADIVSSFFTDVYNNGKRVDFQPSHSVIKKEGIDWSNKTLVTLEEYIYAIHGSKIINSGPVPKLINRKLFEGIDYYENVTIGEDYSMLLELINKAKCIRALNLRMYFRRIHGNNISRQGYTERHKEALNNYIRIRNELMQRFPKYRQEILEYHIEYELAVITAMCRNSNYDKSVIKKLRDDLKQNMSNILFKMHLRVYYIISILLIAYAPYLFITLFRVLHLVTGR